jgi:hypothetical protein
LSFKAEQNCAQNSGAKRRDDINSLIIAGPLVETQTTSVCENRQLRPVEQCRGCTMSR